MVNLVQLFFVSVWVFLLKNYMDSGVGSLGYGLLLFVAVFLMMFLSE